MSPEPAPADGHVPTSRAVTRHLALVVVLCLLGGVLGWVWSSSVATTWTSTARVLVNPVAGNPFVPTPAAVRQEEQTSLETEAQVARSVEVLAAVAEQEPALDLRDLELGLTVAVPPNTQVLEVTYSSTSAVLARRVADAVAEAYLANRERRAEKVTSARLDKVDTQTRAVVDDLRAATAAAQQGTEAERLFHLQLARALRNQLVGLRAQRTALEAGEAPAGSVIAPAGVPDRPTDLVTTLAPGAGLLAGLVLGCLAAVAIERSRGRVRSGEDLEELGLPVLADATEAAGHRRLLGRGDPGDLERTVRRARAALLALEPRPDAVAVLPAGPRDPGALVAEALAESYARAGHPVVLVRVDEAPADSGLVVEDGLAQVLLYERLNVLDLLQPTVEPLLSVLPAGAHTHRSRELLTVERLRCVVARLVEAGNVVVVQSPHHQTSEGQVVAGSTALGLVVVTAGGTRRRAVERLLTARTAPTPLAAVVVDRHSASRRPRPPADDVEGAGALTSPALEDEPSRVPR